MVQLPAYGKNRPLIERGYESSQLAACGKNRPFIERVANRLCTGELPLLSIPAARLIQVVSISLFDSGCPVVPAIAKSMPTSSCLSSHA